MKVLEYGAWKCVEVKGPFFLEQKSLENSVFNVEHCWDQGHVGIYCKNLVAVL